MKPTKRTTKKASEVAVKEKQYVVLCEGDLWVVGTRQDVMDDFNEDPNAYMEEHNDVKIYELGEEVPFTFNKPNLTF
jgi:hypothetical protein